MKQKDKDWVVEWIGEIGEQVSDHLRNILRRRPWSRAESVADPRTFPLMPDEENLAGEQILYCTEIDWTAPVELKIG